jgi:hypothetical protein
LFKKPFLIGLKDQRGDVLQQQHTVVIEANRSLTATSRSEYSSAKFFPTFNANTSMYTVDLSPLTKTVGVYALRIFSDGVEVNSRSPIAGYGFVDPGLLMADANIEAKFVSFSTIEIRFSLPTDRFAGINATGCQGLKFSYSASSLQLSQLTYGIHPVASVILADTSRLSGLVFGKRPLFSRCGWAPTRSCFRLPRSKSSMTCTWRASQVRCSAQHNTPMFCANTSLKVCPI